MTDNIYSSVPDHAFKQERTIDKLNNDNVLAYLKTQNIPVSARKIAINCGLVSSGTQVEVRQIITRLIEINQEPIISVGKGFMIATSREQLSFYADRLEERIRGIQRRVNAVRQIALTHSFKKL